MIHIHFFCNGAHLLYITCMDKMIAACDPAVILSEPFPHFKEV